MMGPVKLAKTNTWNVAALAFLIVALTLSTGATTPQTGSSSSPATRSSTNVNSLTGTRPSAQPPNNDPGAPAQGQGSAEEPKQIKYISTKEFRRSWRGFWGRQIDAFFNALARFTKETILPIVSNSMVPVAVAALIGRCFDNKFKNKFKGFCIGSAITTAVCGLIEYNNLSLTVLDPKIGPLWDILIGTVGTILSIWIARLGFHNLTTLGKKMDLE